MMDRTFVLDNEARVEAAARPAGEVQAQAVQHRVQQRVAQAGRGAEAVRALAGDVGQRLVAVARFV